MSLTAALYARLAGDEQLVGMLATYEPEPGTTAPAIFTTDPPPSNARLPYIVTAGEVATNPRDTKDLRGLEYYRDVRCYTARTGSDEAVEDIAMRIRTLLHRQPLVVDGVPALITSVTGPRRGPDEDKAVGRILTLRVVTDPR